MRIAVLGAGLIGRERLLGIKQLRERGRDISVCGIFDPYAEQAKIDVPIFSNLEQVFDASPDWIVIATPHDSAVELAIRSLHAGFKVLMEKPLGRSIEEARRIVDAASRPDQLSVGFNYRFYEGIAAVIEDARKGAFGPLISVNITLGHGCNPDITKGWKLDPVRAGGGALIDPGVHLLDLCRLIGRGQLSVRSAWAWDGFWNTGVEEEVRLHLDAGSYLMDVEISIVRWRSVFQMEVHGRDGYGIVTGRNRSYGMQRYIRGKRWGWQSGKSQAESEELVLESNGEEVFADEMDSLFFGACKNPLPACSAGEALAVMALLEECRAMIPEKTVCV
jgi:predicted dehydrogenase